MSPSGHFRNKIWVVFLLLGTASLVSAVGGEVSYKGKTLSRWLELYKRADAGGASEADATLAIRAIGTNALPSLLGWLEHGDLDEQSKAKDGFQLLGLMAAPAVTALGKMLMSTNEVSAIMASTCLGEIGQPALPVLLDCLTNRQFRVGTYAALALADLGTNAAPAIPIFLHELESPHHFRRERAANALAELHIEPILVVPALTQSLPFMTIPRPCASSLFLACRILAH